MSKKLTPKQIEAMRLVLDAGPEGLDFYWYPARGRKVLINGNCENSLSRAGLIKTDWRKGPNGEKGSDYFGESRKFAVLTEAGLAVLESLVKPSVEARAEALVARIREAGATKKLRACYDSSQGNADSEAPEGSEAYEQAQHEHAIAAVFMLLGDLHLLAEGDDERIVNLAYSEIS